MSRNQELLLDGIHCCQNLVSFTAGMNYEDFCLDLKTQNAVFFAFINLNEAFSRLPADFRDQCSNIPFDEIRGLRNRIVHQYDDIALDIVWETIQRDIPMLLQQLEVLFEELRVEE